MGEGTEANKISAIAMGSGTTASGNHSTAMGRSTEASGTSSTAMGGGTLASGGFSTAMGNNTTANGEYSTAMGNSTTASGYSSLAIGQYNVINNGDSTNVYAATNTAFSIGNGTSSASRSNALSVLFNGNVTAGSVIATSLEVERTNTDNDITDGISIDLTKTSSGTGYSTRARGVNIEVENSGTAETYSTTGVKSLSKYSGAGNAYFLSGIVSTTTNEGSGDLSAFYGMYTTLNSNGTGVQDVDYMIGNTIAMNFNNPNLDVNRVGCINAQLYFKAATTINTEAYVMLLDTDFDGVTGTDVTVNGDFSYLFIKPHTAAGVPTVTGTARAINSESTLPSVFAGSVGSAGMNNSAIAEHTDNAAAITAGLSVGTHYRTGDLLKIVH
jgi:hypothetical protein